MTLSQILNISVCLLSPCHTDLYLPLFHSPSLNTLSSWFHCASPPLSLFLVFILPPMFLSPRDNFCHRPLFELSVYLLSAMCLTSSPRLCFSRFYFDPLAASSLPVVLVQCIVLVSKVVWSLHLFFCFWPYRQRSSLLPFPSQGLLQSSFLPANLTATHIVCVFL